MGTLVLNSQTVLTQTGTNTPVIANTVLAKSFTELDTAASNGATSNADNTALPLFGCRAFVNFDGTDVTSIGGQDHCAIKSSGNVSKVVRRSTGDFEIYFENAMPDAFYSANATGGSNTNSNGNRSVLATVAIHQQTSFLIFTVLSANYAYYNPNLVVVSVFR